MLVVRADSFSKDLEALRVRARSLRGPVSDGQAPELASVRRQHDFTRKIASHRFDVAPVVAKPHVAPKPNMLPRALTRIQPTFIVKERRALREAPLPCVRSTWMPRKVEPSLTLDAGSGEIVTPEQELAALTLTQRLDDDSTKPYAAERAHMRLGDTYGFLVRDVRFGYVNGEPASRVFLHTVKAQRAWYMADAVTYSDLPEMGYSGPASVDEAREQSDEREALDILDSIAHPELRFSNTPHVGSVESEFAWLLDQVRLLRGSYSEMLRQATAAGFTKDRAKGHAQLLTISRNAESLIARYNARRCVAALADRKNVPFRQAWESVMADRVTTAESYAAILERFSTLIGRLNMAALLDPERGHIPVESLYRMPQPALVATPGGDAALRPLLSGPKTLWPSEMVEQYARRRTQSAVVVAG